MSSLAIVQKPELEQQANAVVVEARALTIADQNSLDQAGTFLTERIKPLLAAADEAWDETIAAAHKAHKTAVAAKKRITEPLEQAERILKASMGQFIRLEEERQAAERRCLLEEEERRMAELREQEIEAAERAGDDPGYIQALAEAPLAVVAPVPEPTYRKPVGISTREDWDIEVASFRELCRAIGNGLPESLASPNMPALRSMARAAKGALNIPGVRVVRRDVVSARRR